MKKPTAISIIAILLLLPFTLTNSACSKECGLALCDLVTKIATEAIFSVSAGVPFELPNVIDNVPNTIEKCRGDILETLTAGQSESRLQIDFDELDDNSFSQPALNNNFIVPEIPSNSAATETYGLSLDEPGKYRIITHADNKEEVQERDNDNNASAPKFVDVGRSSQQAGTPKPLIIEVLPNSNFKRKEGAPYVRLLYRTVKVQ